jgi:hypothetical protein
MPPNAKTECEILQSANVKVFSFSNLKSATRNFRPDSVLGEGGFGSVYKGWIDENTLAPCRPGTGIAVAVKRLNQEGLQGHREWLVSIMQLNFMLLFWEFMIVSDSFEVLSCTLPFSADLITILTWINIVFVGGS